MNSVLRDVKRLAVFERDAWTCRYCGFVWPECARNLSPQRRYAGYGRLRKITVDHVVPKAQGGRYVISNLVTSCEECNVERGHAGPRLDALRAALRSVLDAPDVATARAVAALALDRDRPKP